MNPNTIQQLLSQKRQEIGARYAELPSKFTSTTNDPQLTALGGREMDKIRELYEHDKTLADRYANPQSEAYLEDPYAREKARAIQSQATLGEIGDIQQLREQRKSTLDDALERGLKIFLAGITGLESESDFLEKMLEREDKLAEKRASKAEKAGKASALQQLFKQITEAQTRTKKETSKITPGMEGLSFETPLPGPINIEQETPSPAAPEELRRYLAAFISQYPEDISEASSLYKALIPEEKTPERVDLEQKERNELEAGLPPIGTKGFTANDLYLEARKQAKYLSDSEIKSILNAKGWITIF